MKRLIISAVLATAVLAGCNTSKEVCTNRHSVDNGEKVMILRHGTYFNVQKKRVTMVRWENSDKVLNLECERMGDTITRTDIVNGCTIINKFYNE